MDEILDPGGASDEQALWFALDALTPEESAAVRQRMATDPRFASDVRQTREILAALALALPLERPSQSVRSRLMQRIRPPFEQPQPGIVVARGSEAGFSPTLVPGISAKQLHYDPATCIATTLLRLEPGAIYPRHRHHAAEHCYVISGDLRIGDLVLRSGDYERAEAGTQHDCITSDNGCLLLIIASQNDEWLRESEPDS